MKLEPSVPPRLFGVGTGGRITITDCGRLRLDPDEQITFVTPSGGEYDVTRKAWGFYATPSTNGRLTKFGLRAALVRGADGKFFVMLVERNQQEAFAAYLAAEALAVVVWLDDPAALEAFERSRGSR